MGLNKVSLIGRVGKEPEIRAMQNGNSVASFSIACSEKWKDKDGERKEKTEWFNVVVFSDGLVNVIKSYVKKGSQLYLEGKLQTRKWQDKDGNDKYTTEVVLQGFDAKLILLDKKELSPDQESYSQAKANGFAPEPSFDLSDEIPF